MWSVNPQAPKPTKTSGSQKLRPRTILISDDSRKSRFWLRIQLGGALRVPGYRGTWPSGSNALWGEGVVMQQSRPRPGLRQGGGARGGQRRAVVHGHGVWRGGGRKGKQPCTHTHTHARTHTNHIQHTNNTKKRQIVGKFLQDPAGCIQDPVGQDFFSPARGVR